MLPDKFCIGYGHGNIYLSYNGKELEQQSPQNEKYSAQIYKKWTFFKQL